MNESGEFGSSCNSRTRRAACGVRAAYNSARYLAHRRTMLAWWADYLDAAELAGAKPTDRDLLSVESLQRKPA